MHQDSRKYGTKNQARNDSLLLTLMDSEIDEVYLLMFSKFTQHPASVGETYFQHMGVALSFFGRFCYGAFAALVHAFFPVFV